MSEPAKTQRVCRRCRVIKSSLKFPAGRTMAFGYICWLCVETEAWRIVDTYVPFRTRQSTFLRGTVKWRRCSRCGVEKRLGRKCFYPNTRDNAGRVTSWNYECIPCSIATATASNRAKRETPQGRAIKARKAAEGRAKRATPEGAKAHKEAQRRYQAKVQADPIKRAERAEHMRIAHRLRREREGRPVTRQVRNVLTVAGHGNRRRSLPSEPMAVMISSLVAARRSVASVTGDYAEATVERTCRDLGVSSRTFRRWRDGSEPNVGLALVESALLAADLDLASVYSFDDHAGLYADGGVLAGERSVIILPTQPEE